MDSRRLLHDMELRFSAQFPIEQFGTGYARTPEGALQRVAGTGIDTSPAGSAETFADWRIRRERSIGQKRGKAHGTAEFFRHQQTAFSNPPEPGPGGRRLMRQRRGPVSVERYGISRDAICLEPVCCKKSGTLCHNIVELPIHCIIRMIVVQSRCRLQASDDFGRDRDGDRHADRQRCKASEIGNAGEGRTFFPQHTKQSKF